MLDGECLVHDKDKVCVKIHVFSKTFYIFYIYISFSCFFFLGGGGVELPQAQNTKYMFRNNAATIKASKTIAPF